MAANAFNPSIQEVEAGGSWRSWRLAWSTDPVPEQAMLYREALSWKTKFPTPEIFKWGLICYPGRNVENSAEGNLNNGDPPKESQRGRVSGLESILVTF